MDRARAAVAALLGISTFTAPLPSGALTLDSPAVKNIRKAVGGQLEPLPQTKLRWILSDLEVAMNEADTGDLSLPSQLVRAMKRDAFLAGVLSTRTEGVIALPLRYSGNAEQHAALEGRDGSRSVFEQMCPPKELAAIAADGILVGVGVGELVDVPGRDYPVLVRHDPQNIEYRWDQNRYYFRSIAGLIAITPGDGRWVLHIDGARIAPWQAGLWYSLGQSWINKQHAQLHKANWEAKLANPARVAYAPQAASEGQKNSWFKQVMAWGVNTVFGLTPGYEVKLLESNGRGYEAFVLTIQQSEREYMVALAGQVVTTDGGVGFSNADIHQSIRANLIKATADALAYTINTQVLPAWVVARWGEDALQDCVAIEWDTRPPKDIKADAEAVTGFGNALATANAGLEKYGMRVDADELGKRFGVPMQVIPTDSAAPMQPVDTGDAENDVVVDVDLSDLSEAA